MPAVVSVQVKYANVAATGGEDQGGAQQLPNGLEEFFKQFPQFRNGMPGMPGRARAAARTSPARRHGPGLRLHHLG